MALLDRCFFNSTTSGLADFGVGAAVTGALLPSQAGAVNGAMYPYIAQSADQTQWEVGIGMYNGAVVWTTQTGSTQHNHAFGATSVSVNSPTGVQAGDVVVIVAFGATTNQSVTAPAGFSTPVSQASTTDGVFCATMFKVAGASEPASYTLNFGVSSTCGAYCFRVSVSGGINPVLAASATQKHDNGDFPGSITFPTVAALPANTLVVCGANFNNSSVSSGTLDARLTTVAIGDNTAATELLVIGTVTVSTASAAYTYSGPGVSPASAWAEVTAAISATVSAAFARSTVLFSSNSNNKVNFTNPPQIAIGPIAGLDFGNQPPVTITGATYTVDSGSVSSVPFDTGLICNGSGTITLTLPSAAAWPGREIKIKSDAAHTVVSASSNVIPLTGGAAGTAIFGATAGDFATLQSDTATGMWRIMSGVTT